MESLKEQLMNRCVHFNGLGNKICEAEVVYDEVKDFSTSPYKVPCFASGQLHGGKNCRHVKYFLETEAIDEANKIETNFKNTIIARGAVVRHYRTTNKFSDVIVCPVCSGKLSYSVAPSNEHVWMKCNGCDILSVE